MKKVLSFDDVLIVPKFSNVVSRQDVNVTNYYLNYNALPVISSNMDTVTGVRLSQEMSALGAASCLHRFWSIEENLKAFKETHAMVSVGLGKKELERFEALYNAGAHVFVIDVAHGASTPVVQQVKNIREIAKYHNIKLVVGNFATGSSICDFIYHTGDRFSVDMFKVGIGGGSACTTRIKTGCGLPTFASILDCTEANVPIIADGGIRNSGDFAKALAAGADAVMVGGLLAGTDEAPGELVYEHDGEYLGKPIGKKYRGSASAESYMVQGKVADHRTPEGESFIVPYRGSVKDVLQELEAGLRSAMSYVGASNLQEFRVKAGFVEVTAHGAIESRAHGRK